MPQCEWACAWHSPRRSVILLDGTPLPPDTSSEELGPWAETVRLLMEAQAAEGAGGADWANECAVRLWQPERMAAGA